MIERYGKRVLAFVLAMIMIISVVPAQVFAAEVHDHENEVHTEEFDQTRVPAVTGESEALVALRAEIAAYIEELGITPDMPDQVLLAVYNNHLSHEAAQASLTKQDEFLEKGKLLSEAEQKILLAETNTKLCQRYRNVAGDAYALELMAECTVNGVKFATNSKNSSVKVSGTTVTATVKGNDGGCNGTDTANTMVLYITNTNAVAGAVSFNMSQTSVNSIYVGDANGKSTGESLAGLTSFTKGLAANESFTIIIDTGANTTENKLVMSNVAFISASTGFTVTVKYPTANGSVTASVEGSTAEADGITTLTIPDVNAADGVKLTANSSTFLCWVDENNKLLSRAKEYTVNPSADTTVKAVMTGGNACFQVNGDQVFDDLNQAIQVAAAGSNKTVVLMNNGTLPAGNYTIPSGVTLLIP